jgi:methionyl-tRNA formyltransferase
VARELWRVVKARNIFASVYHLASGRVRFFPHFIERHTDAIRAMELGVALHACGVIYRQPTIEACGRGILNSHIGTLPRYRGRCVAEWSVLEGNPTGITCFFIDEGVDTGRWMVLREEVSSAGYHSIAEMKRDLFGRDGKTYRKALEAILAGAPMAENNVEQGNRYYPMSKLFLGVVEEILSKNAVCNSQL